MSGHGIHSPFVFHFATVILKKSKSNEAQLPDLKRQLKVLKSDKRKINVIDLGAGSINKNKERSIASISRNAATPIKYCSLLNTLIKEYKPSKIIELGTSLGISTAAMALASPDIKVYTIEGSPELASVAKENFKKLELNNIEQLIGPFDEHLPMLLSKISPPFIAFVDGNHRYKPTIKYFEMIAAKSDNQSIIVIDDIHWSEEMGQAWDEICTNPKVTVSIDLYRMGIVFFNKGLLQQRFNLLF
jgi:predicted O-methyltransferase YrrM